VAVTELQATRRLRRETKVQLLCCCSMLHSTSAKPVLGGLFMISCALCRAIMTASKCKRARQTEVTLSYAAHSVVIAELRVYVVGDRVGLSVTTRVVRCPGS
jgi:hypothetical protein